MNENGVSPGLIDSLRRMLEPLEEGFKNEKALRKFIADYGWDATVDPSEMAVLRSVLGIGLLMRQIEDAYEAVETKDDNGTGPIGQSVTLIRTAFSTIKNISGQAGIPQPFDKEEFWQEFIRDVINDLTFEVIEDELPVLFAVMTIVGLFEENTVTPPEVGRVTYQKRIAHWEMLGDIITDPLGAVRGRYGWGDAVQGFKFEKCLRDLEKLFTLSGFTPNWDVPDQELLDAYFSDANPVKRDIRQLNVPFVLEISESFDALAEIGIAMLPIPPKGDRDAAPVGLLIAPLIQGSVSSLSPRNLDRVELDVSASFSDGSLQHVEIRPDAISSVGGHESFVEFFVSLKANTDAPRVIIGTERSHRIEVVGALVASLEVKGTVDDPEVIIKASTDRTTNESRVRFIFRGGEGDGFVKEVVGEEPRAVDVAGYVSVSTKQGVGINGKVGFQQQIPIHIPIGTADIESLQLGTAPTGGGGVAVPVGLAIRVRLGPLNGVIEDVGAALLLTPTVEANVSGLLGNLDIDWVFKPPHGVGLSVDGGGFKGGGFLRFEPESKRYTGALELEFKESIALKAVGLLTTELPGGEPGFSLLIVITAEFQPIQLGLGFTLNGVGGLLGLNRTARIERLRTGLRDNTLSSILFPSDAVANANRIISDLREVFPPQADRFVFGPMAKLGWGSPTIITIDLGLIIEVPAPVQLAILGVLKGLIPDEKKKLLRLQVNFLGVVELEEQRLAFDASLYDSKLLNYPLSGDMALRLVWGNNPNFLLSVGGFHPSYEPPPLALPKLRRLTIQLTSGNNPRLTLETYFAVTSNTVQFGAKVELYAKAGSFNVYGMLAFDALFQFNPFYFVADVTAKLALRKGSSSIASITLSMTLEGTTPWRAKGTARLKLAWFLTVKVRFDRTFGERRDTRLDDIAVLPLVRAALEDSQNWHPRLPTGSHLLVSVRESEGTGGRIVAHPVGVLEVSQKVVPLNVRIERFGHRMPSDGREFRIQNIRVNGDAVGSSGVKESFAPAQFFEMSDAQKLSSKSFEKYDAGVALTGDEGLSSDFYAMREVEYELSYRDSQRDQLPPRAVVKPDAVAFGAWASKSAVARSPLSFTKGGKSALTPGAVSVIQEGYGVVGMGDLSLVTDESIAASEAEAVALMGELIARDPTLMGRIQVVPLFEAVERAA